MFTSALSSGLHQASGLELLLVKPVSPCDEPEIFWAFDRGELQAFARSGVKRSHLALEFGTFSASLSHQLAHSRSYCIALHDHDTSLITDGQSHCILMTDWCASIHIDNCYRACTYCTRSQPLMNHSMNLEVHLPVTCAGGESGRYRYRILQVASYLTYVLDFCKFTDHALPLLEQVTSSNLQDRLVPYHAVHI